ncbi:MAG: transglutaminase TgpA family protein [Desulfosalsimonas sp.]
MNEDRKYIPALTGALFIAILPHALTLPVWITAWCALMWGYLLASLRFGWPRPKRKTRVLLSIVGIAGLLATYNASLGPEGYVGLLAVMAALKPFESSTHRDRMITAFIAYFIIISKLLEAETLAITLYMFFSVLVTTAALVRINNPYGMWRKDIKKAGTILAQAAPVMILMFVLFPRMEGSLIGMRNTGEASTGFSDQLSPGSISKLAENNEIAFRAEFKGPLPPPDRRYWRGIVFTHFDGKTWRRSERTPELEEPVDGKKTVSYTISLEPHRNRWLFALELPVKAPSSRYRLDRDFTVRAKRPVTRKRRYEITSYTEYKAFADGWGVEKALRLPENTNPRTRDLGKKLAREGKDTGKIIEKGLDYLKDNDFVYTLEPPLLGKNPADDFLFESRRGFCEHFASAFACLMRAAGVPARVVGGYLGGEINPFAEYLIIRQSDAHAWVEVWYREKGWVRVDPTLAAAPDRLEQGIEAAFSGGGGGNGFAGRYLEPFTSFAGSIKMSWDAVSLRWEEFFYAYSQKHQKALLEKIGIYWKSWKGPLAALGLGLGLATAIIILYGFFQFRSPESGKKDPVKKYYEKFCKKLERSGIARRPNMGPKEFSEYAAASLPSRKAQIDAITDIYIRLRFRDEKNPEAARQLRAMVRDFNPPRAAKATKYGI